MSNILKERNNETRALMQVNKEDRLTSDQSCSTFNLPIMTWDFIGVKLIGARQLATKHLHAFIIVQGNSYDGDARQHI